MSTFIFAQGPCVCGAPLNAASDASDANDGTPPTEGDFTVCAYCERVLTFDAALVARPVSADELARVGLTERGLLLKALAMLRKAKR